MSEAETSRMSSKITRNRASRGLAALSASEKDIPLADFQFSRQPIWKRISEVSFEEGMLPILSFRAINMKPAGVRHRDRHRDGSYFARSCTAGSMRHVSFCQVSHLVASGSCSQCYALNFDFFF